MWEVAHFLLLLLLLLLLVLSSDQWEGEGGGGRLYQVCKTDGMGDKHDDDAVDGGKVWNNGGAVAERENGKKNEGIHNKEICAY